MDDGVFPTNVMRIPNTERRHSGQIRCICVKIHFDESSKKPLLHIECNLIEAYQITTYVIRGVVTNLKVGGLKSKKDVKRVI